MRFQLIISICAAIIPVLAFLLLIPKRKKKNNQAKQNSQLDAKQEKSAPKTEKEINLQKINKSYDDYKESLNEDFKRYAKEKQSYGFKPKRDVAVRTDGSRANIGYSRPSIQPQITEAKDPIQEFNDSSDELKTLIISGFLDKKDYDDHDF